MAGRNARQATASTHAAVAAVTVLVMLTCQDASGDQMNLLWRSSSDLPPLVPSPTVRRWVR